MHETRIKPCHARASPPADPELVLTVSVDCFGERYVLAGCKRNLPPKLQRHVAVIDVLTSRPSLVGGEPCYADSTDAVAATQNMVRRGPVGKLQSQGFAVNRECMLKRPENGRECRRVARWVRNSSPNSRDDFGCDGSPQLVRNLLGRY